MARQIKKDLSPDEAIAILESKGLFDPVTRDRLRLVLERIGGKVVAIPGVENYVVCGEPDHEE
jgi:sensor c-di-GMP phosphodiesterase-like protein